jgi:hypothetical protein
MVLGELIAFLEKQDPEKEVKYGFTHPHSYRGFYNDLAVEPFFYTTISEMLTYVKGAIGNTYQGYKGGEYKMNKYCDVYLAYFGETGDIITEALLCHMLDIPYSFGPWKNAE